MIPSDQASTAVTVGPRQVTDAGPRYAFPYGRAAESRRLQLLEQRLDPITTRRVERLGLAPGARCLGRSRPRSWPGWSSPACSASASCTSAPGAGARLAPWSIR
jgi:hypothetical protein